MKNPAQLQEAVISGVKGKVLVLRNGQYLPALEGMPLHMGDRVITDDNARAVVKFSGVEDPMVIEQGSAATFELQVMNADEAPQWVATDLFGEGVFFEQATATAKSAGEEGVFGLVGPEAGLASVPVLETLAALGGTAAIVADSGNDDTPASATTTESGTNTDTGGNAGGDNSGGETTEPPPSETAGPLDAVLEPVNGLLDTLLGATGLPNPIGALPTDSLPGAPTGNLPLPV